MLTHSLRMQLSCSLRYVSDFMDSLSDLNLDQAPELLKTKDYITSLGDLKEINDKETLKSSRVFKYIIKLEEKSQTMAGFCRRKEMSRLARLFNIRFGFKFFRTLLESETIEEKIKNKIWNFLECISKILELTIVGIEKYMNDEYDEDKEFLNTIEF